MNTLFLAWRNLLRNPRRSLVTLTAMMLGLTAVLLFGGYVRYINYALQSDFVRVTGHLQVQHKDYLQFGSGNAAAYAVARYRDILVAIRKDLVLGPMLVVSTPTLQFGGIAGNYSSSVSRTVFISGLVVEDQNRMREWNDYGLQFISRPLSLLGTPLDAAIIGTGVARALRMCAELDVPDCASESIRAKAQDGALPADIADLAAPKALRSASESRRSQPRVEILAANARGAPNVAAVKVLSAEFQGIRELDDVYVGLHLSQAQRLIFGAQQPQATAIVLQLRHTSQIPAARKRLEEVLSSLFEDEPLSIVDYETLNPFYGQTLEMFAAIFGFISTLISAIVLFTVANTMSMSVVERTPEIGTLRAIGLRRSGIRAVFVSEGLLLGAFGAILGIGVTLVMAWIINQLGLTWTPPGRVEPVPLTVRLTDEHGMVLFSALGLVLVATLSALVPAVRASRMNIVEALRHV
jgi:putative ABC transport system permease protein